MSDWHNFTIERVYDCISKKDFAAADYLADNSDVAPNELQRLRIELERVHHLPSNEHLVICYLCQMPLMLRGNGLTKGTRQNKKLHFTHSKPNANCEYQTPGIMSREEINRIRYHGQREGIEHKIIKQRIAELLILESANNTKVSQVEVEQIIFSDHNTWRKPDINFHYGAMRIALEIQLSTTYLDVINERHRFYKSEGIFMLWIFNSLPDEIQLQRFAKRDVLFNNNENSYVFTEALFHESLEKKQFLVECFYIYYTYNKSTRQIHDNVARVKINLAQIHFDSIRQKLFYFDSASSLKEAKETRSTLDRLLIKKEKIKEQQLKGRSDMDTVTIAIAKSVNDLKQIRYQYKRIYYEIKTIIDKNEAEHIKGITEVKSKLAEVNQQSAKLINGLDLIRIPNSFKTEFYSINTEFIFGKHRLSPVPVAYGKNVNLLLKDIEANKVKPTIDLFIMKEKFIEYLHAWLVTRQNETKVVREKEIKDHPQLTNLSNQLASLIIKFSIENKKRKSLLKSFNLYHRKMSDFSKQEQQVDEAIVKL